MTSRIMGVCYTKHCRDITQNIHSSEPTESVIRNNDFRFPVNQILGTAGTWPVSLLTTPEVVCKAIS